MPAFAGMTEERVRLAGRMVAFAGMTILEGAT
jgi:uncharacterized Zn-binding protein involved in type VI secretion